jgi:hypothetical protein
MEEVFLKWSGGCVDGTDKNTTHSYLPAYERVFSPLRDDKIRLLEIGVFSGGSLRAWADYFTHDESEIIGLDINPHLVRFDLSTPKIKTMILNATKSEDTNRLEGTFNFIIDDGSHALRDQIASFKLLGDRIRPGGAYIIEDVQSMDDVEVLMTLGREMGWEVELSDTRHVKGRYDDLMIIYTKK